MLPETTVILVLVLVIIIAVVAATVRHLHFPYTVALVVTGGVLALVPGMPHVDLTPDLILTLFLPVLLFHGAFNLDLLNLRALLSPMAMLAFPGVLLTAALVGAALHYAAGLAWQDALLFGAIVSATDPVAVLAIFGEVDAPNGLATLVTGESLFNDGTALVLFTTLLGIVSTHVFDAGATVVQLVLAVVGGMALGIGVGFIGSMLVQRIDDALLETTITLILAYGGYLLAGALHSSGPLETVTAAIVFAARGRRIMSPSTRIQARAIWEFLDFLANSLLFLLVGLALRSIGEITATSLGWRVWWPLLIAIGAVVVARVMVAWITQAFSVVRRAPLPKGWTTVLIWGGLRGAVSLAAALTLPLNYPARTLLLTLTFGIVLFTLLVQATTIRPLLARLGIVTPPRSDAYERTLGHLRAAEAAQHELQRLGADHEVDAHVALPLTQHYAEQIHELRERLDQMFHQDEVLVQHQSHDVQRHLLRIQREAVREMAVQGRITESTANALLTDIDRQILDLDAP